MLSIILTSVLDVDKEIFLKTNDQTLFTLSHVSKKVKNIIVKDYRLYRRYFHYKMVVHKLSRIMRSIHINYMIMVCLNKPANLTVIDVAKLLPNAKDVHIDYYQHLIYHIDVKDVVYSIKTLMTVFKNPFYLERIYKHRIVDRIEY